MKKNKLIVLSFLMAAVMMLSAAATVSAADTTVTLATETYYVRSNETGSNQIFVLDGYLSDHRLGFMKVDFSSIDLGAYPGMKLKLISAKGNNGKMDGKDIDVKISIIPEALEDAATVSALTYSGAKTAGWLDDFKSIGSVGGTIYNDANYTFYSTNILDAIREDIEKNNDYTVVLKIESNILEQNHEIVFYADYGADNGNTVRLVAMTEDEVNEGKAKAQADADALSIANTAELGSTIVLPSEGTVNNSKITWESDSAYINADTGAVASAVGFADEVVTLTATVNYNGLIVTKSFQVTLQGSNIQPVGDYVTIKAHGTGFTGSSDINQQKYLIVNPQYTRNKHQGILRFDLAGIKASLNSLEDISLRLTFSFIKQTSGADLTTGKYILQILPDMDWNVDTMTFDYIYKYGADIENPNGTNMFAKAVTAGITGTVPTAKENTMVFGGLKAAIEKYIAENPNATTITFLLAGENPDYSTIEDSVRFYVPNGTEDASTDTTAPVLIGETAKRFTAINNNGEVTFTYNVDSAKYPAGINMPATFFAAEYNSSGKLVNVTFEADADSKLTSGETKTLTINGFTSGNKVNAMVFNNLSEIMPMQPVTPLGN